MASLSTKRADYKGGPLTFEVLLDAAERCAPYSGIAEDDPSVAWIETRTHAPRKVKPSSPFEVQFVARRDRARTYLPEPPFTIQQVRREAEEFVGTTLTAALYTAKALLEQGT